MIEFKSVNDAKIVYYKKFGIVFFNPLWWIREYGWQWIFDFDFMNDENLLAFYTPLVGFEYWRQE